MPKTKVKAAKYNHPLETDDNDFRTAHIPAGVLASLTTLGVTEGALREDPLSIAKLLSKHGQTRHCVAVRYIEGEAVQRLASVNPEAARFGIELSAECSLFYHAIGQGLHAIKLLEMALLEATRVDDMNLLRRMHNSLGGLYATRCEFEKSCEHLEKSLILAKQLCIQFIYSHLSPIQSQH